MAIVSITEPKEENPMKKLAALLLSMLMLAAIIPAMAETADDMIIVYAKVPADWTFPCVWAWASDGTNAFASWPGDMMEPDAKNDGWYYCSFLRHKGNPSDHVPCGFSF